jgi:hypothetical protein
MAGTRKRALSKAEPEDAPSAKPPSLLQQIRNMWQFANLFQFIMLFGKALKMDDNFDIEVRVLEGHHLILQVERLLT